MQISFVLVEPAVPENVGAAARALKTMGFSRLLLVNPCEYLSGPSKWLAHGSAEILENALVFSSLAEAVAGFDFIIGTSAKKRNVKHDSLPLPELRNFLKQKGDTIANAAVVFGREESGLTNDELKLCDLITTVPMKKLYPSVNLAQAVMLYAWELSVFNNKEVPDSGTVNEDNFRALVNKVHRVMIQSGFKENSAIYSRFIERISFLQEDDIHLLHSFCNKLLERLE